MSSDQNGLVVKGLRVDAVAAGVDIVAEVDLEVPPGTALGIVGESGCGKTTVALALLGFARPGTQITGGEVRVEGVDILALTENELRSVRGRTISYVPQNPSRALSPAMRVESQLKEMTEVHASGGQSQQALLADAWEGAQLPADPEYFRRYPHQLSGGQQQRVAIAMALVCEPSVIVMDEPTTGLDVLTQRRLLDVIRQIRQRRNSSIVYISHDLAVIRNLVDEVAVMYGGRIVERGPVEEVFGNPRHPYTRGLLGAIPRVHQPSGGLQGIPGHAVEPWNRPSGCFFAPRCDFRVEICDLQMPELTRLEASSARCWRVNEVRELTATPGGSSATGSMAPYRQADETAPLLVARGLVAGYGNDRSRLRGGKRFKAAVTDVSFELASRECLAVVGESGSGKTTLARCVAGLHEPAGGELLYDGRHLAGLARQRERDLRRRIQIVFQDPDNSLNPTMTVGSIVRRPLQQLFKLSGKEERERVSDLLQQVHLAPSMAVRFPRDLSGGEKQRVAIARALAAEPELLICDEITSALDVAVQASVLELLQELRISHDMALLFVTHDLAVVRTISDNVLVMRDGRVCEHATTERLFAEPTHAYTRELIAAAPDLNEGDYAPASVGALLP